MAKNKMMLHLYTAVILFNVILSFAQGPDADAECTNSLLSLINCEPFLAGTVANPTETCCLGLGTLVKAAPLCLCGVLEGNPAFSSVNLTRALLLPDECDIPIDESQCAAITAPPPKTSSAPDTGRGNAPPTTESPGSSASPRDWSSLVWFAAAGALTCTTLLV